jgi:hypothetical protein
MQNLVQKMTFDVIGDIAFGVDLESQASDKKSVYHEHFDTMAEIAMLRSLSPFHWWNYFSLSVGK